MFGRSLGLARSRTLAQATSAPFLSLRWDCTRCCEKREQCSNDEFQLSQAYLVVGLLSHDVPLPLRRSLRRARRLVLRPGGRDLQDALRRAGGFDGPSRCTRYRMRMRQRFKVPQTIRAPTPKLRDSCAHAHLITHQLYHPLHPILFSLRLDTTSLSKFPPIQVPPRRPSSLSPPTLRRRPSARRTRTTLASLVSPSAKKARGARAPRSRRFRSRPMAGTARL